MNCGSLQTQEPTWLDRAYATSNLSQLDVGSVQRTLINHALVLIAAKVFRVRTILDFGGGDGLLCRLLRDRGLNAETIDPHAKSTYASCFEGDLRRHYDLITAFEVIEHFAHPSTSFDLLFQSRPRFMIASTELYSGQDHTWWYLSPDTGQHVFFYSRDSLGLVAKRYKYSYYNISGWHIFSQDTLARAQVHLFSRVSSGWLFRLFRATLPFTERWDWIMRDYDSLRAPHD